MSLSGAHGFGSNIEARDPASVRALMKLPGWLLAILTVLLSGECWGATATAAERWSALADVVFEHLARDNELPNSTAPTALAQDGEGFLWVGTQNGLAFLAPVILATYPSINRSLAVGGASGSMALRGEKEG